MLKRFRRFWEGDRGLSALLVSLLLVGFVAFSLERSGQPGNLLNAAFLTLTLVSGAFAVSRSRWQAIVVAGIALVALALEWVSVFRPDAGTLAAAAGAGLVALGLPAAFVLGQVFREGPITVHRVVGAVVVYLLLGVTWAQAYEIMELLRPGTFLVNGSAGATAADLVYFSFVTLTTVGFGDVLAMTAVTRPLVVLEALVGQLFPAILIARLVSMELASRRSQKFSQVTAERPTISLAGAGRAGERCLPEAVSPLLTAVDCRA